MEKFLFHSVQSELTRVIKSRLRRGHNISLSCQFHWRGTVQDGQRSVLVHRPLQLIRIARTAVEQTMYEACSNKHCDWHLHQKNMAISCDLL